MRYEITVENLRKRAKFYIDTDNNQFIRKSLESKDMILVSKGELISVKITDVESGSYQEEKWLCLMGTKSEIYKAIDEEWPMARLELVAIKNYLDNCDEEQTVFLTYPTYIPEMPAIRNSPMRKMLRACHRPIISNLYGKKIEEIEVLPYQE